MTKIMSTHGLINEISNHKTYRRVAGEWNTFNYNEPISHQNHSKHWVGDVNARRHDPIGLEDVWHTKCFFEFSGACQEAISGFPVGVPAEIGKRHASE